MTAMFSNNRTTTSSSGHMVEFKAGRSRLEPGSAEHMRRVVAEPTKGLVYIKQSSDMLVHFCWKDRESGALVDDLIIFPEDAEFKAVNGCTDGKVYMLKFKSSGEMKLFWLQDSNPDAEKDLVKKVNDALNKPPTSRPSNSRSVSNAPDRSAAGGSLIASGQDFNAPLGGLDQGQLMSLIQSLQGNTSDTLPLPPSQAAAASAEADCEPPVEGNPISLNNPAIQSILNNFGRQNSGQGQGQGVNVSLGEALANDEVAEVVRNHAEELTPHIPQSNDPAQELSDTVKTPQFRQVWFFF
uniref:Proteasomal ubiquitin receptor ADRM1 homolog n=1 Tax=Caenorhabditis japonica TaxID=281687 RepID=A0A8R1DL77_CAEJA